MNQRNWIAAAVIAAALGVMAPAQAEGIGTLAPASKPLLFGERQANKHYEPQRVPAREDIRTSLPGLTVHDRLFDQQLKPASLRDRDTRGPTAPAPGRPLVLPFTGPCC